jgi:hypothetical protein
VKKKIRKKGIHNRIGKIGGNKFKKKRVERKQE